MGLEIYKGSLDVKGIAVLNCLRSDMKLVLINAPEDVFANFHRIFWHSMPARVFLAKSILDWLLWQPSTHLNGSFITCLLKLDL